MHYLLSSTVIIIIVLYCIRISDRLGERRRSGPLIHSDEEDDMDKSNFMYEILKGSVQSLNGSLIKYSFNLLINLVFNSTLPISACSVQ